MQAISAGRARIRLCLLTQDLDRQAAPLHLL